MWLNYKQLAAIQKIAQEKLNAVYDEHFPESRAPNLSPGIIRIVVEAATEAGIVKED